MEEVERIFNMLCLIFVLLQLQSFKIKAPADNGPKTIKLFINQPKTLDFDSASGMTPVQEIM
jgi:hypothetical protein